MFVEMSKINTGVRFLVTECLKLLTLFQDKKKPFF